MTKKILIMGLPGADKTTLAKKLVSLTNAVWLNADEIRKKNDDWDFSYEGRMRQAKRMSSLADKFKKDGNFNNIIEFCLPKNDKAKELWKKLHKF